MTGLTAGDTLAIAPGTYSGGGTFSNLRDLTIINNGGVVTFTGTVIWGGTTMHNIKWTGVGYTGAFYGFVFNTATAFYGQASHTDSTRFDHLDFENASSAAFDFGDSNYGITFNGSSATYKMHCMTFSDLKVFNSSLFIITGYNDPTAAANNLCDSIDMHNIIIQDLQGPGQQVRGTMTHFNMYNWTITYSGTNTLVGDQGVLYINGNGSIHHNYMHGGRGYLARIVSFSMKPLQDSTLFYNNIILSTTHYGGLDIRCDSVDIPWRNSAYLNPIKNVYVVNNTIGNKWNQNFVVPVVVQYQMHNNNILYCKNNLSFAADPNVTNLPQDGILVDYNQGNGKVDTSNNKYYSAAAILSYLQDTLATCRPKSVSALNGAGVPYNFIATDYYDKIRPTPPSIGAVEYAGINSTVIANAGANQTVTLPLDSVALTGVASVAINATITSYQWTQASGPSTAKFGSPILVNTMASTLKAGVYIFSLKVKNSNNDSSTSSVTITVNPQNFPPVVSAGSNQTITLPTSSVTLTGTATDATGTISTYLWTQVSGPNTATITSKAAISSTVTGLIAGSYVFQLKATDNLGLAGNATVTITVNPQNLPPLVSAGSNQTITLPTSTVTLTGTATDATGTIASYLWTQVSGPNTAAIGTNIAISTTVTGLIAGSYVFQLQATDNLGLAGNASVTVTVNPAPPVTNLPPVVNTGIDQTITAPVSTVSVDGSLSSDPDGSIATFVWSQISGPSTSTISTPATAKTTISSLVPGIYVFKLTVTDNLGLSASAQITINVNVATAIFPNPNETTETMLVFPNPATNHMNLAVSNSSMGTMTISIIDVQGKLFYTEKINKAATQLTTPINVSQLPNGTYFLLANFNKSTQINTRFIKQ
jgi:hypothetical protein